MQRSINSMIGYAIRATDGDLGKVDEFYFDDGTWTIRYLVVETGNWLSGRKVLISPVAFGKPELESRTISANLTCAQVRSSPDIDTERPIYRQHEVELQIQNRRLRHFGHRVVPKHCHDANRAKPLEHRHLRGG